MQRRNREVPIGDTDPFQPTRQRPVRVRARDLPADSHFDPHQHGWSQLAYCATGILQVTTEQAAPPPGRPKAGTAPAGGSEAWGPHAAGTDEVTYIVPPSRAVWIAPGARHAVHVLEAALFRTLYIHPSVTPPGWDRCRVIMVSPLLREMIQSLDAAPSREREALLTQLVLDEITHADPQSLGVPMPSAQDGDKRLRALCEAVLREPSQRATLAGWAADVGASERTMARLFREELGTSYQQWRQQAILAHALPMLARGVPVSHVAAASGYASDSAFTAMFKGAMGQSPRYFQDRRLAA
ncbi:MAG: AraC family transcriptional regulator [Comamonadaceae bacterium]|nr:MAG: AraC family transcriptional regulator [Comamonadaceae bacterium]